MTEHVYDNFHFAAVRWLITHSSCRPVPCRPVPCDPHCLILQDYPLAPLEDDCKLLGALLDDCLKIEVGDELFEKVALSATSPVFMSSAPLNCDVVLLPLCCLVGLESTQGSVMRVRVCRADRSLLASADRTHSLSGSVCF